MDQNTNLQGNHLLNASQIEIAQDVRANAENRRRLGGAMGASALIAAIGFKHSALSTACTITLVDGWEVIGTYEPEAPKSESSADREFRAQDSALDQLTKDMAYAGYLSERMTIANGEAYREAYRESDAPQLIVTASPIATGTNPDGASFGEPTGSADGHDPVTGSEPADADAKHEAEVDAAVAAFTDDAPAKQEAQEVGEVGTGHTGTDAVTDSPQGGAGDAGGDADNATKAETVEAKPVAKKATTKKAANAKA